MKVPIAFSPCPNDTFLFYGWVSGTIKSPLIPHPRLADIQQLNEWAREGTYPLIKVSFNCLGKILDTYQMLPIGSALGFGCGPKIISRTPFPLEDLPNKRIAVPGKDTTAHLLLQLLAPEPADKLFCLYDEAEALLEEKVVDAAVIIHEQRFTYRAKGFHEIADLGVLWEEKMKAPLPLGCLAVRRDIEQSAVEEIVSALTASIDLASNGDEGLIPYILEHSLEKDPQVVQWHIETYVNDETRSLSNEGIIGIEKLLAAGGHSLPEDWLRETLVCG